MAESCQKEQTAGRMEQYEACRVEYSRSDTGTSLRATLVFCVSALNSVPQSTVHF